MAGQRYGVEPADQGGRGCEYAHLEENLHPGGKAESQQAADAREIGAGFIAQPARAIAPEDEAQQQGGHVDARDHGGPGGSRYTHRRRAPVSVDQCPVAGHIHEVGGDQRKHYGPRYVYRLQVAPRREVNQQRKSAPRDGVQVRSKQAQHCGVLAQAVHQGVQAPKQRHQDGGEGHRDIQRVAEGPVAVPQIAGAECLRYQRVEA